MTAFAAKDKCRAFVSTAQLHVGIPDFLAATLEACLLRNVVGLQIVLLDSLNA